MAGNFRLEEAKSISFLSKLIEILTCSSSRHLPPGAFFFASVNPQVSPWGATGGHDGGISRMYPEGSR
jgi:hypothetical protein